MDKVSEESEGAGSGRSYCFCNVKPRKPCPIRYAIRIVAFLFFLPKVRPCLESHATAVVSPPIDLGPHLASLLKPEADMKIKHGVIGLLRHLAYVSAARAPCWEVGIIEKLETSILFRELSPTADLGKVSVMGLS